MKTLKNIKPSSEGSQKQARRTVVKTMLAGGVLASSAKILPESWVRPVSESVMLPAHAQTSAATFMVTVQNMTAGQPFSPPAIIAHGPGYTRPSGGDSTSGGLEVLAEGGNPSGFLSEVAGNSDVSVATSLGGPVGPGGSGSTIVSFGGTDMRITVVSMLVNTNDAFTTATVMNLSSLNVGDSENQMGITTYDAGTEVNDQLAANIPGPAAGGEGFNADRGNEGGSVTAHQTLQAGVGDIDVAALNWSDPVLNVTVTRTA